MNQYFTNNPNLKSNLKTIKYNYGSTCLEFLSDNGVFSKSKIDYGSKLLVETYLKNKKDIKTCLDVGCGYGFISIVLAKILNITPTGIDVNDRALKLAEQNVLKNKVNANFINSNIYENINSKYDLIITNPPIRAGNDVVLTILKDAVKYLNKDGELWAVIRKDQGAKSIIKKLEPIYKVEIKEKSKGFYIFVAKNN